MINTSIIFKQQIEFDESFTLRGSRFFWKVTLFTHNKYEQLQQKLLAPEKCLASRLTFDDGNVPKKTTSSDFSEKNKSGDFFANFKIGAGGDFFSRLTSRLGFIL